VAGAGFSAENLDIDGKELLDYQSCKNKDLFKGFTYDQLVNHQMYFNNYKILECLAFKSKFLIKIKV
jgi:hypothetical protein